MALREYCMTVFFTGTSVAANSTKLYAQTFTPTANFTIDNIGLFLYKTGIVSLNVWIEGVDGSNHPNNTVIASGIIANESVETTLSLTPVSYTHLTLPTKRIV